MAQGAITHLAIEPLDLHLPENHTLAQALSLE